MITQYRDLLIEAAILGEDIKEQYGIVPPAVLTVLISSDECMRISLSVNRVLKGLNLSVNRVPKGLNKSDINS